MISALEVPTVRPVICASAVEVLITALVSVPPPDAVTVAEANGVSVHTAPVTDPAAA
jgi:hypothetical protein